MPQQSTSPIVNLNEALTFYGKAVNQTPEQLLASARKDYPKRADWLAFTLYLASKHTKESVEALTILDGTQGQTAIQV
jgi:hypothetical protein